MGVRLPEEILHEGQKEGWPEGEAETIQERLGRLGVRDVHYGLDQVWAYGSTADGPSNPNAPPFFEVRVYSHQQMPWRAALWDLERQVREWEEDSLAKVEAFFAEQGRDLRFDERVDGFAALLLPKGGSGGAAFYGVGPTRLEAAVAARTEFEAERAE